jgi:succinate dehydrogenase / fumarate reductase flavoprotein subunit
MYYKIVDEDPYNSNDDLPCGTLYDGELGLIIIYKLGCFSIGESNFSDHGANRLGASALMQGLADGYFVLPYYRRLFITRHKNGTYIY